VEVESVQQAIVDTVQIGDRQKLVGQKERLKKLARDPRPEVRRTALWALGRCATVRDALVLVKALDDPDINVVVEANAALCWLSRRPNGFGRSLDPLADVPETASDQQRHDAMEAWRKQARRDWREWFNQVGPYSEHELPIDLPGTNPP
jgi:HEAT repeat protein